MYGEYLHEILMVFFVYMHIIERGALIGEKKNVKKNAKYRLFQRIIRYCEVLDA